VVVDRYDKIHNPTRHLIGIVKAAEFHERMTSLGHDKLLTVEVVIEERAAKLLAKRELYNNKEEDS
jgi:hypothetical protein